MDRVVNIRSPENVEFSFALAGLGTRFLAMALDYLITVAILVVVSIVLVLISAFLAPLSAITTVPFWLELALWILCLFIVKWGYYVFFEWKWNGQSPGKKVLNIRVADERGGNITFSQVALRNLLRIADMMPISYLCGFLVILCNSRNKRLGDLAAGTLVIKDEKPIVPASIKFNHQRYNSFRNDAALKQRMQRSITKEERMLLVELCSRRDELETTSRTAMFAKMSTHLQKQLSIEKPSSMSDEKLVENVTEIMLDNG